MIATMFFPELVITQISYQNMIGLFSYLFYFFATFLNQPLIEIWPLHILINIYLKKKIFIQLPWSETIRIGAQPKLFNYLKGMVFNFFFHHKELFQITILLSIRWLPLSLNFSICILQIMLIFNLDKVL